MSYSSISITHSPAYAREDIMPWLLCKASWPKKNNRKSEVMALEIQDPPPVLVYGKALVTTEEFTYLGSSVTSDGRAHNDIRNRINKAAKCIQNVEQHMELPTV